MQFNVANYERPAGAVNTQLNLAPANRADLLVKAPATPGTFTLCVVRNNALFIQNPSGIGAPLPPSPLLTVNVTGTGPAMDFIPPAKFPTFPAFLKDIQPSEIHKWRELVFGAGFNTIDGKKFEDGVVNQQMTLNTAEEWTVKNQADDKSHPFHIHINPFQITEFFDPALMKRCSWAPNRNGRLKITPRASR